MSSIASQRMSMFHHSRELPADPAWVYQACSNPELLAQWWGPEGFTNTFAVFEFHPGGKWLFTMHGPDGTDYPNESEFLEIVPDKLIRIKHVNLPHFVSSMSFAASENGTRVTWDCEFENAEFAEKMRQFLEQANEQNLDRLTEVVREITTQER